MAYQNTKTRALKNNKNKNKKKKKRYRFAIWLLLLLVFASAAVVCGVVSYDYVVDNFIISEDSEPVIVDEKEAVEFIIERGASSSQIVKDLVEQGLIKNELIFKLLSKVNGYDGTYKSGTHLVSKSLSYDEMMRVLSSEPATRTVMIPEGKTFKQIVDILYDKKIIKDKVKFIKVANTEKFDYDFLKDLPERDNRLEGYLFPDTYEYDYNASEREIIIKMLDNFDKKFQQTYKDMIANLPVEMTMDKVVIMASLIEREAKDPDERHLIAGVMYNRLKNKDKSLRKLQVDATIQYIMLKNTGAYKDRLLYEDLEVDDPYNTYNYEGLPPGPICCPGEAAIKAAVNPDETSYLYYVAKGDGSGGHAFARTYKEHQANRKKYAAK